MKKQRRGIVVGVVGAMPKEHPGPIERLRTAT